MSLSPAKEARIASAFDKLGEPEKQLLRDTLCKVDAVAFARIKLDVMPDGWQRELMRSTGDLAALCGRRVGKSQSAGWVAAHHVVEGEGRTALCISPTQRQSGELFRLAKAAIVKAMPDASFPTDNRLSIELPNGSRLLSLPGDPGTVRGLTASLVLLPDRDAVAAGPRTRAVRLGAAHAGDDRRQDDRAGHAARPQRAAVRHLGRRHRDGLDARARAEHALPAHPSGVP